MTNLAPVLQGFFTQRLAQRRASPATVANYRDTYRLLLKFASQRTGKAPSKLALADLDATLVCAFLDHLETCRSNSPATRNTRLIAIRSLFSYAALTCPEDAETIRRVLAIPNKRTDTPIVSYLTRAETDALLASPDRHTPLGRRDHALLLVAVQTGLRVSELTSGVCSDIAFGTGANIHTNGKGRRQRSTPLLPGTAKLLQTWLRQRRAAPKTPSSPLAPAVISAPTPSRTYSTSTSATPRQPARPWPPNTSRRTPCATRAPCTCSNPGSTSPPSRCGSATPAPKPPRPTSTPTSN